jgi:hypothetical protein
MHQTFGPARTQSLGLICLAEVVEWYVEFQVARPTADLTPLALSPARVLDEPIVQ